MTVADPERQVRHAALSVYQQQRPAVARALPHTSIRSCCVRCYPAGPRGPRPLTACRIIGARIDGDFDLSDAHVRAAEVWLDGSWIAGDAISADARLDGLLSLVAR